MIAMTAIVKPSDSVQVLHLLEQCLRRHFPCVPDVDGALMIQMPVVGPVVVTEQATMMRLEFMVPDSAAATVAMRCVESELHAQVRNQGLTISWELPAQLQPALS